MKKIEDYTLDELAALYKRMNVQATTWFFKYYRQYKMKIQEKEEPILNRLFIIDEYWDRGKIKELQIMSLLSTSKVSLDWKIGHCTDKKRNYRLQLQRMAYDVMINTVYWFGGIKDVYDRLYQTFPDETIQLHKYESPEEMETFLRMNDDVDIEYGLATNYQAYEFVWETLQYLNIKQLKELLDFCAKGVEQKWQKLPTKAGRKSKQAEILQVEIETGDVVCTYKTRNEIIEKLGIKKSHLSQCIKTSKENIGDRTKWKKWISEDNRKFGFLEFQ